MIAKGCGLACLLACFFVCFVFLGQHLQHMDVPRLGSNRSCSYQPTPEPWQCQILNPLSKARDQTGNLRVSSRICFHHATKGNPGCGLASKENENVLKLTVATVAHISEYMKNRRINHFKWVNCTACEICVQAV